MTGIDTNTGNGCTLARCTVDGMSNPNFYYDNDGNMRCITTAKSCDNTAGRTYGWTSFDMVSGIGPGSNPSATTLSYTPEHGRGALTTGGATMYYLNNPAGADMEELVTASPNTWHTYLYAYGHIAAEFFTSGGTVTPYYFVGDHLASTTALSDPSGNRLEYDSYDAWGRRRNTDGSDFSPGCSNLNKPPSKTTRGFTGQEEMDAFCLVNLNGRIYDPALGRMLSADPMVSEPMNGQAFDRYSYVLNNPLSLTDPSGYAPGCNAGPGCGPHPICVDGCGMPSSGMPCWDCTGPGLTNDANGNPAPASNYGGGWNTYRFGWNGGIQFVSGSLNYNSYTWLDQSGNSCSPGSSPECWGIPNNPPDSPQNPGGPSLSSDETVVVSYDASAIIHGLTNFNTPSGLLEDLGSMIQNALNSPAGVASVNDINAYAASAKQIGGLTSKAGATGAIMGARFENPTLIAAGVFTGIEGLAVSEIGGSLGVLGGALQSIQQGSWGPFDNSIMDYIEPDFKIGDFEAFFGGN